MIPPAFKALLAQLLACVVAYVAGRSGMLPPGLWPLVLSQALAAVMIATILRSARWWLPIHLAFMPTTVAALQLEISPGWYLGAFILLALVYWSSFRTQVPLYLSNRKTAEQLSTLLPTDRPATVLDIGSGTGSLLRMLARLRPDCHYTGIEAAPAPWALGWLLGRRVRSLEWHLGDFFTSPWQAYDVVYAFLSPVPMTQVWTKAQSEMKPGSLLVSNSFAIPGREPDEIVQVDDGRRTRLLIYRIGAPGHTAQARN
nr:class I SAM-dependent methyltransferase [Parazoarcus communis]